MNTFCKLALAGLWLISPHIYAGDSSESSTSTGGSGKKHLRSADNEDTSPPLKKQKVENEVNQMDTSKDSSEALNFMEQNDGQHTQINPEIIFNKESDNSKSNDNPPALPTLLNFLDIVPLDVIISALSLCTEGDIGRILQTSKTLVKVVGELPIIWNNIGLMYTGDYPEECWRSENSKKTVVAHYLRMQINLLPTIKEIRSFIDRNRRFLDSPYACINSGHVFKGFHDVGGEYGDKVVVLDSLLDDIVYRHRKYLLHWASKGSQNAQAEVINYSRKYKKPQIAKDLIEFHIKEENLSFLGWRLEGYMDGAYGYEKNPKAAVAFIEGMVAKGNQIAISFKMQGLTEGKYGYDKNPKLAAEFNESLVNNGDRAAISRKLWGLAKGRHGYSQDIGAAKHYLDPFVEREDVEIIREAMTWGISELRMINQTACLISPIMPKESQDDQDSYAAYFVCLNDILVGKKDHVAICRKIDGLTEEKWGYKKDFKAAQSLIEGLIENGCRYLGIRNIHKMKIEGLSEGKYGYEVNPEAAVEFNESWVEKGDAGAIYRKVQGLAEGKYGYEVNPEAAVEFNESLVQKKDPNAIDRKITGYNQGYFGYQKDDKALKAFIDDLASMRNSRGIQDKTYGIFKEMHGYETNEAAAKEFLDGLIAEKNIVAHFIKMKILHRKYLELYYKIMSNAQDQTQQNYERLQNLHGQFRVWIDFLCEINWRAAHYMKGFALRQGLFGYVANEEEYKAYIRQHKLAY